jgi:hypothetical protein
MPDTLDLQIRSMVTELVESAPQAPLLPELEWGEGLRVRRSVRTALWRVGRARPVALLGGVAFVAAIAIALALVLPAVSQRTQSAAAAELHQIAANASGQTTLQPSAHQWLYTKQQLSALAQVTQVGSVPTPDAQATIGATIEEWSNVSGQSCESATSTPAQFASPANQAAWQAAGLLNIPTRQPNTSCTTTVGATAANGKGYGSGVINVSALPTDPAVLARDLIQGTTGIDGLDGTSSGDNQNAAFERAAVLLIGPTVGTTPAFSSALYNALATLPGISLLGEMTTHTGTTGLGFSASTATGPCTIIVDPSNGSLLEVRNVPEPSASSGLGAAYLAPLSPHGGALGGGVYDVTIQWQDPIGVPTVVGANSLTQSAGPPELPKGSVVATAKLGVTYAQLTALKDQLKKSDGLYSSFDYEAQSEQPLAGNTPTSAGAPANMGSTATWTFDGPKSQVRNYKTALAASGLFSAVNATYEGSSL